MSIAVLVSGGVDSSVALALLKERGFDVTAFYLKIWLEDELSFLGECPWEEDLEFVRGVTRQLGVPLEIVPFQKEYWERVVAYTINEVKHGRTPNPDMLCNARIKFGAFYDHIGTRFEKVATGHYAQVQEGVFSKNFLSARIRSSEADTLTPLRSSDATSETMPAPRTSGVQKNFSKTYPRQVFRLKRSADPIKDQTYFLSQLSQKQLSKALFPIGEYTKTEVRDLAQKFKLSNAGRKDSQGICFLGKIPFDKFLAYHLGEKRGTLVEFETGKKIGEHNGFWYFTVGQRQGIRLSGGPWYVVKKDPETNTIFISHAEHKGERARDRFLVGDLNWFNEKPEDGAELSVKLRHGPKEYACTVQWHDKKTIEVFLKEKDPGISEGQFAVFYSGEYCLGGGVIR